MRKLLEHPVLAMWIEALETENPVKKVAPADVTPHGAYIMLGEQTGWNQFKERFMLGGKPKEPPPQQEEMTYADPVTVEQ